MSGQSDASRGIGDFWLTLRSRIVVVAGGGRETWREVCARVGTCSAAIGRIKQCSDGATTCTDGGNPFAAVCAADKAPNAACEWCASPSPSTFCGTAHPPCADGRRHVVDNVFHAWWISLEQYYFAVSPARFADPQALKRLASTQPPLFIAPKSVQQRKQK